MDSSQQQHAKVERFLKLGYSQGDIVRVLQSLGHDAQTNDILEELIKTCHTPAYSNHSLQNSPKLVSRGCSPAPPTHNTRQPDREAPLADFRPVVIDGSNVAMSHGDKKVFSCRGLQLAVNWFMNKGLRDITVFVPLWRKEQPRPEAPITDQHILHELERRKILVYTPSRCVNGKRVVCYDDRYIIKLAFDSDGIVVSNDNYRDLQNENPQWKKFIEERLLMYTFANDKFMPPDDPLGRNGPTIDDFLRRKPWTTDNKPQHCPYGKKCTYGVKCKFYHPERVNQSQLSVADELRALRDRAKNISPKASLQDTHCPAGHLSSSPSPPPGSPHHHRDSSSPRSQQPNVSLHHGHSSSDLDEAFSSMDSSLSRLYIQDVAYSMGQPLHSYSSGVASYSISQDDYSLPGSRQCRSAGAYYPNHTGSVSSQCRCGHQQTSRLSQCQPPAWGSCPALLPHNTAHVSEKQFFRPDRQGHSLPRDPWSADRNSPREQWSADRNSPREQWSSDTQSPREQWSSGSHSPREQWSSGSHSPREQWSADRNSPREQWSSDRHSPREQWSSDTQSPREQWSSDRHSPRESWLQGSRTNSPSSEQRTGLRSQLSTLFPPSVVEQVMSAYPHVSDMSQLISLIQSYRTSLISY